MINGLRVKQVREFLGLTQQEVALRLSVSQSTVAYIEGGYLQPEDALLQNICEQTGFPRAFFEDIEVTEFPQGSLLFRSRTAVDAKEKNQAIGYGHFLFKVAEKMAAQLDYPQFRLPKGRLDAELAANITRSALGLTPDTPIDDLIYELESRGVFIFQSPMRFPKVEAFAVWAGHEEKKPVIVLTGDAPADRTRWSVAHELGHLILHATLFGDIHAFEKEADRFASELLLPEPTMRRLIVEPLTLLRAMRIRSEWKISVQAIVRRAHELHLISDSAYKSLFVQISQQKKKLQELSLADTPERPRCLRSMAEALYGSKINYQQFSKDTTFPTAILKQFINAQASYEEYTRKPEMGKVLDFPDERRGAQR